MNNDNNFCELLEAITRMQEQAEALKDASFWLDHIVIPGRDDGDRAYNGITSVPKVGEGIHGFYEGDPYLLQVVGFTFYEVDYQPKNSKSIGALLLNPIAPSDGGLLKFPPQS